jgi:hypothetical protein
LKHDARIRSGFLAYTTNLSWHNPFAVTLTFKQCRIEGEAKIWLTNIEAEQNVRHFLNLLNRSALGKSAVKRGLRLQCVGVFEKDKRVHSHYCIDAPIGMETEAFIASVVQAWHRTHFGYVETYVKPCTDLGGWLGYIAKYSQKSDYADSIDWMNTHKIARYKLRLCKIQSL